MPTTSAQDYDSFQDDFDDDPPQSFSGADADPPLRCFSVADAIAQGSYCPRPVAKMETSSPLPEQHSLTPTSEAPARPSMLRLKSESSAFHDMISPRSATRPLTATESQSVFAGFSHGSRDRSSSHESTASSTSYTEDFQQASERRKSVRELAESINRKHANKHDKKQTVNTSNLPLSTKVMIPPKQHTCEIDVLPERQEPIASHSETNVSTREGQSYDVITASSKPLCLKAAAIERKGTVERKREGLNKYGHSLSAMTTRKLNIHTSLAEEGPLKVEKKSDPHISAFTGQQQGGRPPARGILKNSGLQGSPARTSSKRASQLPEAFGACDSGFESELVLDTMSCPDHSLKHGFNPLTSPDCEEAADYEYEKELPGDVDITQRSRMSPASGSRKSSPKSHKKSLSKSNSLPSSDSPTLTPSDDESETDWQRCPSAPAASLLSEDSSEPQALFPIKDDSLVEDATTPAAWSEPSKQTSPIRRYASTPLCIHVS